MGFKCGIVGLPNVGKSTLFNALTETANAQAENYPFCTIEPNVGEVPVPDNRLGEIAGIASSQNVIPARLTFVDIAGLVKGASKGEGLGNQFLANIREVDAIAYVLRCFENDDITHVEGRINPVTDAEIVETELMLADLESLEKRLPTLEKKIKGGDKEAGATSELIERTLELLRDGKPARLLDVDQDEQTLFKSLNLLTSKPVLYVCNVEESDCAGGNDHTEAVAELAEKEGAGMVTISAAIEAELSQLDKEERSEFLNDLGLQEPGLNRLIRAGYDLLGLMTYFTCGPKEARAWTIRKDTKAPQAAGVIHTDFERGFICAETIDFEDYVSLGGETPAKEAGKMRQEGKDYTVKDGDIILFRFNT